MVTACRSGICARKHGIPDADILHALRNVLRYVPQEHDSQTQVLVIGPALDGKVLELATLGTSSTQDRRRGSNSRLGSEQQRLSLPRSFSRQAETLQPDSPSSGIQPANIN